MDYSKIVFIFALGNNTDAIMLGIESPRKPITGQFAKELREALVRARTGNLNQSEKIAFFVQERIVKNIMQSGNNGIKAPPISSPS